jgi:hypothetical protein
MSGWNFKMTYGNMIAMKHKSFAGYPHQDADQTDPLQLKTTNA